VGLFDEILQLRFSPTLCRDASLRSA